MTLALCSTPAHQAIFILEAWKTGDVRRLCAALEGALAPSLHSVSPGQLERTELLQAVATKIRKNCLASQSDPDAAEQMEVCLGLLQHLVAQNL